MQVATFHNLIAIDILPLATSTFAVILPLAAITFAVIPSKAAAGIFVVFPSQAVSATGGLSFAGSSIRVK